VNSADERLAPNHGHIIESSFQPAWWLPGPHLQTLWPSLTRPRPKLPLTPRRIELADGDFIDLAVGRPLGPRVLVIHGLEGNLESHYAGTLLQALESTGYQPIFMHLRGCSDETNRLDRAYHSGASEDLAEVLAELEQDPEGMPLAAIGFSLGANLLLKYLGEQTTPLVRAGIAVSVPFVLRDAMLRLDMGASRIYRRYLLDKLRLNLRRKFASRAMPLSVNLDEIRDFNQFDELVTAPLNGFDGVFDYYNRASCRPFLQTIATPTLIIQAKDDPFMFPTTLPWEHELGPGVTLELAEHGGHVGFVAGRSPRHPVYWLEQRIPEFLAEIRRSDA